jgi:hypothetical protein
MHAPVQETLSLLVPSTSDDKQLPAGSPRDGVWVSTVALALSLAARWFTWVFIVFLGGPVIAVLLISVLELFSKA